MSLAASHPTVPPQRTNHEVPLDPMLRGQCDIVEEHSGAYRTATELQAVPTPAESVPGMPSRAPGSAFAIHLCHPGERRFAAARRLEGEVFARTFGMTTTELELEYAPYDIGSVFVVVEDCAASVVVGCARLIIPGHCDLKTFIDAELLWGIALEGSARRFGSALNRAGTWDVSTLAVHPEYRRGTVSLGLYQGICTTARLAGGRWLVAGLDVAVLRLLQIRLAQGFSPFPGIEPKHYVGSLSTIVWAETGVWHQKLKDKDPHLGNVVFEGLSLAPAVAPPDWSRVVSRIRRRFPVPPVCC